MKKQVKILLIEPKPLLTDLTIRAIEAKPDDSFELDIVANVSSTKEGFVKLQKYHPHILVLDTDAEEQGGVPFIVEVLKQFPHLKVIVMSGKVPDEKTYLEIGASALIHLPFQRAALWRKLDQLIEESNSVGLLDEDVSPISIVEEQTPSVPAEDLFVFDTPTKESDLPAITQDVVEPTVTEETPTSERELPAVELFVIEEDESIEIVKPTPSNDLFIILDDEEPEVMDWEKPANDMGEVDEDEFFVFDPFAATVEPEKEVEPQVEVETEPEPITEEAPTENTSTTPLFLFDVDAESEESNEETQETPAFEMFRFDVEEENEEVVSELEATTKVANFSNSPEVPNEQPIELEIELPAPLIVGEPHIIEEKEDIHPERTPGIELELELPVIELPETSSTSEQLPEDTPDVMPVVETPVVEVELPTIELEETLEVPQERFLEERTHKIADLSNSKEEIPVFELTPMDGLVNDVIHKVADSKNSQEVQEEPLSINEISTENEEITLEPQAETPSFQVIEDSNEARTLESLYLQSDEYNKTPTKAKRSFDSGFYNRDGAFVPLYPPREKFLAEPETVPMNSTVNIRKAQPVVNTAQSTEDGLFASVKKLFKRR